MDTITIVAIFMSSLLYFLTFFLGVLIVAPCWDEVSTKYCGELCNRFVQLGIGRAKLNVLLRMWGVLLLASLFIGWAVKAIPLGIFVAAIVAVAPVQVLQFLIRRHESTLDRQMVQVSAALANSMRAGMSLKQALEAVAADTPEPLKQHLDRVVFEATHGRPLVEALQDVRRRLDIDSFSLFAAAISVNLERGGPLNESLARISLSLQESERLQRKLAADTAAGRQMLIILAIFPVVFLALFAWLEPHGVLLLFQTMVGQLVLMAVGVVVCIGVQWGRRIMSIDM